METKLNLLMDYVQILNGKFQEHIRVFPLQTMIDEIMNIVKLFAWEKNLGVIQEYNNDFNELVECDHDRIFSILIHTSLNCIKFTLKGTVSIKAYIDNDFLNVVIKDSGIGISQSFVNQINSLASSELLENSQYLNNSFDQVNQNKFLTGLGLTSSSLICKILGGSLIINSIKDVGTTLNIRVKCKKIKNLYCGIQDASCILDSGNLSHFKSKYLKYLRDVKKIPENFELEEANLRTLLVLLVDDQPFNRTVIKSMLDALEIRNISEAENGEQAVTICKDKISTVDQITVFMDIDMPIMNGIDATRIIKSNDTRNKIKIVMLSAFNSEDIISTSLSAGAQEFCVKPISFQRLKEYKDGKIILY